MHLLHACYIGASLPLVVQVEGVLFLNAVHNQNVSTRPLSHKVKGQVIFTLTYYKFYP